MPRSSVVLSRAPLDAAAISAAAGAVWESLTDPGDESFELRVLDEGAVLQVVTGEATLVSVLRPRLLPWPSLAKPRPSKRRLRPPSRRKSLLL